MSVNAALTAGELTVLANKDQDCPVYLSYEPNTEVGHATIDGTPATFPVVELAVNAASAGWTDQRANQTVVITNAAGTVLRGYYRVRKVGDATHLYIAETMDADPGLISILARTGGIQGGDLATIYDRRDLWSVKPYTLNGTLYQDYEIVAGTYNATPPPIVNMAINSQPGDYFANVADGATQALSCVVSVAKHPPSSGSTLTYAWAYPASFTSVSGDTTATLTATAPVGSHRVYCTVTDSVGGAITVTRWIRIHSPADPPLAIFPPTADVRNRQGRRVTVRLKQSTISVIPPGARCAVWSDGTWGGSAVASATMKFVGFATQQPFTDKAGYHESELEIVGPCGILDKLHGYAAAFNYDGTTATWENLGGNLSNIHFMMWWILRWHCANVLETFNYTPISTSDTINLRKAVSVAPGSIYSQLKYLADMIDANIGSRSDGEIVCRAHPSMLEDRSGVVTRATLASTVYSFASPMWARRPSAGAGRYDGYTSDLTTDTRRIAQAPGDDSLGQYAGNASGNEKCFASQTDANQKAGRALARANNEYPQIQIEIPNNWDVFEPVDMDRTVLQVAAEKSPTGSAISITVLPTSITKQWIGGRRAKIGMQLEAETNGVAGVTITVPTQAASTNRYSRPISTRTTAPVTGIGTPTKNGGTVIAATASYIAITVSWLVGTVLWIAIAKPTGTIKALFLDPFSPFLVGSSGNLGAWCLTSAGLYYTENILTTTPVWTLKKSLTVFAGAIRPVIWASGVIYVHIHTTSSSIVDLYKLSAYGATEDWHITLGNTSGYLSALDVNQHGTDECLAGVRDNSAYTSVWRVTAGVAAELTATRLSSTYDISFIQRPLKTFAGADNTSTGASECFLWAADNNKLYKTADGGGTNTDITPSGMTGSIISSISSIAYTDDSNRLATINTAGGLFTSTDAGANWTSRGGSQAMVSITSGYYPRLLSGNYGLYMGGTSALAFSPDFGATITSKIGNWATAIGAVSNFIAAIPLY